MGFFKVAFVVMNLGQNSMLTQLIQTPKSRSQNSSDEHNCIKNDVAFEIVVNQANASKTSNGEIAINFELKRAMALFLFVDLSIRIGKRTIISLSMRF